ncbi:MAG TPA: hypothetical protein VD886_25950 [Herpetosiphonaceae bacterium]|nr:hypothetical protein [Herpetosiphonaceae bacterium]
MRSFAHPQAIRYLAHIQHVREVSLYGHADLAFWRTALRVEGLVPFSADGCAELAISATALTWKRFHFRELAITVAVGMEGDETQPGGVFLIRAFNSVPILAFAERWLFKTPYYPATINAEEQAPISLALDDHGTPRLRATMADFRPPPPAMESAWQGPVFLPRRGAAQGTKFFAILRGTRHHYPFIPGHDRMAIHPSGRHPVFQQMIDSGFIASEWRVCTNAAHSKSKTYRLA